MLYEVRVVQAHKQNSWIILDVLKQVKILQITYIWHEFSLRVLTAKCSVHVPNLPFVSSEHTVFDDIKGVVYTADIVEKRLGPVFKD